MDLSLTEEQVALQDSVRALLIDKFPTSAARACQTDPGSAGEIYSELIELGVGGMVMPESVGGLALGLTELVVTHCELGAALVPLLFSETSVLAATLLQASDNPAVTPLLESLVGGRATASCAWLPDADTPDATAALSEGADGFRITGIKGFAPEAEFCDFLLVDGQDSQGEAVLCLVDHKASGITFTSLPNLADQSMSSVRFGSTPVQAVVARGESAQAAWLAGLDAMKVAIAAQAVGGAERVLAMARDYAGTRKQFGQPIGSFQAIAHMLADAAVNVEGARYLVYRAAAAADDGEPLSVWADMAKLKACQTYRDVSAMAIQVHGGIGFTIEADPQLFYRRAKHLQLMYGDPLELQERTGEALISGAHKVLAA